jgi:fructose-bisphosphate aldolase class II
MPRCSLKPTKCTSSYTGLVAAAESKRSPLIIQLFPSTLLQSPYLAHAAAHAVRTATVPISLHIDHAQDVEHIRSIIASVPVDSVMVDMSHYDEAENLAKTRELTKECHERGIAVEAESGRIEGGEEGIADTEGLEGMNTCFPNISIFFTAMMRWRDSSRDRLH